MQYECAERSEATSRAGVRVIALASAAMVGAGAACLGGAVFSRRWVGVIAASVMFLAMLDLAYIGLFAAPLWAAALVVSAMLIGVDIRVRSRGSAEAVTGHVDRGHFARVAMAFSALAYPMAAWLALAHVAPPAGEVAQSQSHLGHGSVATLTVLFPLVLAITLAVTLTVLFVGALRRRRVLIALETGAMAVMIVAMVAMLILPH